MGMLDSELFVALHRLPSRQIQEKVNLNTILSRMRVLHPNYYNKSFHRYKGALICKIYLKSSFFNYMIRIRTQS